eukprot:7470676-Lingulodinium_polyedra.AAC.1
MAPNETAVGYNEDWRWRCQSVVFGVAHPAGPRRRRLVGSSGAASQACSSRTFATLLASGFTLGGTG